MWRSGLICIIEFFGLRPPARVAILTDSAMAVKLNFAVCPASVAARLHTVKTAGKEFW